MEGLILRLERATEADRSLANEVLFACGWTQQEVGNNLCDPSLEWVSPDGATFYDGDQPNPLASLDAALTLVPEGYAWEMATSHKRGRDGTQARATMWERNASEATEVHATSAPLALCIAALKARQSLGVEGKSK